MLNKRCSPGPISDKEHSLKKKLTFDCKMTLKTQILQSLMFLKQYEKNWDAFMISVVKDAFCLDDHLEIQI